MAESPVTDKTDRIQSLPLDRPNQRFGSRSRIVVAAAALLTFFTALGSARLFDEDEPKNAACAREMLVRGDWIVPTFNEELRTDKPILLYWLMLAAYHVFGVSEFAARSWSAGLGVGTCLLTYALGRLLFRRRVGAWAGLIMASTLMFTAVARAATPDSTLVFLTTLSLYLFVRGGARPGDSLPDSGRNERLLDAAIFPPSWQLVPVYVAMSLAVLAKGPIGVILPIAVVALFLYLEAVRSRRIAAAAPALDSQPAAERSSRISLVDWLRPGVLWHVVRCLKPAWLVLCVLLVAGPWYVAASWKTNGAWLEGFLGDHNVQRFLQSREGHSGPVFYYVVAVLAGFFPWSVFLPPAAVHLFSQGRSRSAPDSTFPRRSLNLLLCWIGVYVVFFTLARTKLPNYVLPCYPALALLTGWFLEDRPWVTDRGTGRGVVRAVASLAAAGLALSVGLAFASRSLLPGEDWLWLVGVVPFAGGLLTLRLIQKRREAPARQCLAATAVLFTVVLFGWAAPRISRHQEGAFVAAVVQQHQSGHAQVATFRYAAPSLVFYTRRRVESCLRVEDAMEFLSQDRPCLVTTDDRLDELRAHLPDHVTVVSRHKQFLRQRIVVVLGRDERAAGSHAASDAGGRKPVLR